MEEDHGYLQSTGGDQPATPDFIWHFEFFEHRHAGHLDRDPTDAEPGARKRTIGEAASLGSGRAELEQDHAYKSGSAQMNARIT
jgi:hypothetical protein